MTTLAQSGDLIALSNGEAEVQVGNARLRVRAAQLEKEDPKDPEQILPSRSRITMPASDAQVAAELHLRGTRADDAIAQLEKYLDDAYLAGLPSVRIVHGKGTGALRKIVREMLEHHPLVKSFRPCDRYEGEEGVTVAELAGR